MDLTRTLSPGPSADTDLEPVVQPAPAETQMRKGSERTKRRRDPVSSSTPPEILELKNIREHNVQRTINLETRRSASTFFSTRDIMPDYGEAVIETEDEYHAMVVIPCTGMVKEIMDAIPRDDNGLLASSGQTVTICCPITSRQHLRASWSIVTTNTYGPFGVASQFWTTLIFFCSKFRPIILPYAIIYNEEQCKDELLGLGVDYYGQADVDVAFIMAKIFWFFLAIPSSHHEEAHYRNKVLNRFKSAMAEMGTAGRTIGEMRPEDVPPMEVWASVRRWWWINPRLQEATVLELIRLHDDPGLDRRSQLFFKQILVTLEYSHQFAFKLAHGIIKGGYLNRAMLIHAVLDDMKALLKAEDDYSTLCDSVQLTIGNGKGSRELTLDEKLMYGGALGIKYPIERRDVKYFMTCVAYMAEGTLKNFKMNVPVERVLADIIRKGVAVRVETEGPFEPRKRLQAAKGIPPRIQETVLEILQRQPGFFCKQTS
eukprot:GHVS01049022.1.p1 GENE.GHVS01049022.1~~GHVS01049022.1.p1  ORF type:complete len:486 (-),score=37.25 GHVS01049022.1:57-1514(-)